MAKYLIVNADDYGMAASVSQGIRESHQRGIVTSTTVMIGMDAAAESVQQALKETPDLVIVELGANDMLRGIRLAETKANLDAILIELRRRNIPVLLTGMRAIRNSEPGYLHGFEAIFPELAAKHDIALYPFFLDGVALVESMTLPDGMHPNFRGVKTIVTRIVGPVKAALGR